MSLHSILLVEDSVEVQKVVCASLKKKYLVIAVGTSTEALNQLSTQTFSLILLDIVLPDGDGFKICSHIKSSDRHKSTQIVFLSGRNDVGDKVMGLSLGADDYIVKPVEPMELQARVEARIRRYEESLQSYEYLSAGPFRVLLAQQKVLISSGQGEAALNFTTIEFKLFCYLLKHEDQILSRDQILNAVWGHLSNVTDRTVDTHIYSIRQKLGEFSIYIQAVPRAGYRYSQIMKVGAA